MNAFLRNNPIKPVRRARTSPRGRAAGFTLVELMVALVLGLVLIGGAINLVVTSRNTVKMTENVMRVQENARTAFELMTRDIREAGQIPCGMTDTPNSINQIGNVIRDPKTSANTPWWADWNSGTLIGYASGVDTPGIVAFGTATHERVNGTAALSVMQAEGNERVIVAQTLPLATNQEITLQSVDGFNQNNNSDEYDAIMLCDSKGAAILQMNTVSAGLKSIDYQPGMTTYNCSANLGAPTPADCLATTPKEFEANGFAALLKTTFWYIGYNSQGHKALYRTHLKKQGAGVIGVEPQEVLPDVVDLQIQYLLIDLTDPANTVLDSDWVNADAIADWSKAAVKQVVGVKLTLTFETEDDVSSNNTKVQRQSVHVISLRSRDALL